jgi:hypothetical protein
MPETMARETGPFLASFLTESRAVHYLTASIDGTVRGCNAAMAAALKAAPADLAGRPVWSLLTEADGASLRQRVQVPGGDAGGKFLLNFVDAGHSPFTLECRCEVRPDGVLLLGEPPDDRTFQEEWLHVNNQLAVLGRENARRRKELETATTRLEQTLRDLEGSYWHLKKIQEVLPICMDCGRVKAGAEWEGVAQYLKENALFLSHGYCPDCLAKAMAAFGIPDEEEVR